MASSTNSPSSKENINLLVRSHFYVGSYTFTVKPLCYIKDIKTAVIESFYRSIISNRTTIDQLISHHRLIAPIKNTNIHTSHALRDTMTVLEAQLEDNDELYLLRTLPPLVPVNVAKTPQQLDMDEVQDRTLEKEIRKEMKKAAVVFDRRNDFITALDVQDYQAPEFFSDMRRIITIFLEVVLITLCTLSGHPTIDNVLKIVRSHFLYTLYPIALNPAFVIELRETGYSPERIKYAFHLSKHRNTEAMEWLRINKSIPSIDIPRESVYQNEIDVLRSKLLQMPLNDIKLALDLLTDYRNYTFKPDLFASNNLKGLDYDLQRISDALKQVENSYPAAASVYKTYLPKKKLDLI